MLLELPKVECKYHGVRMVLTQGSQCGRGREAPRRVASERSEAPSATVSLKGVSASIRTADVHPRPQANSMTLTKYGLAGVGSVMTPFLATSSAGPMVPHQEATLMSQRRDRASSGAAVRPKQNLSAVFEQLLSVATGERRLRLVVEHDYFHRPFHSANHDAVCPGRCRSQPKLPVCLLALDPKGSRSVKGLRPPERRHRSQQSPASRRASERNCEHRLEIRREELANLVVVEGESGRPETACVCTEIEPAGADTRLELGGTIPA